MRAVTTAFVLAALAAATVALAQQSPQTTAEPPTSTAPQEQQPSSPPSSDPSAGAGTQGRSADKQALMKTCITQVQASNPQVSADDIKKFCAKEVYQSAPQD